MHVRERTFGVGRNFETVKFVENAVSMTGCRRTRTVVRSENASIISVTASTEKVNETRGLENFWSTPNLVLFKEAKNYK